MAQTDDLSVACVGGCKRTVPDMEAASHAGWRYLEIQNRWRCPECNRELRAAQQITGHDQPTVDELDPTSRGALRKETASTISPPTVPRQFNDHGAGI